MLLCNKTSELENQNHVHKPFENKASDIRICDNEIYILILKNKQCATIDAVKTETEFMIF